jgi:hypothetical protein
LPMKKNIQILLALFLIMTIFSSCNDKSPTEITTDTNLTDLEDMINNQSIDSSESSHELTTNNKAETVEQPGEIVDSRKIYTLSTQVVPSDAGVIEPSGGSFYEREIVTLKAIALEGFEFQNWSGDINSSQEQISFHMVSDMEITATFQPVDYFTWSASAAIQNGIFSYEKVLRAICYGIDERRISQEGSDNFGERIEIMPSQEYAGGVYSPSEAKKLLVEAGYPNGFRVNMYIKSGDERLQYIAYSIKYSLQDIVIGIDLHVVEPAEFYAPKDIDCIFIDLASN